jgi:uncharacterized membrane protein SpoIIM required for sporulation
MVKKHYASKYEFPTRVIGGGAGLQIGHKAAKREVEKRIGRNLEQHIKIVTKGNNWCFLEGKVRIRRE